MVSRYGKKVREKYKKVREKETKLYMCPVCNRKKVKKHAVGIWHCKKCGTKYASDAYEFKE